MADPAFLMGEGVQDKKDTIILWDTLDPPSRSAPDGTRENVLQFVKILNVAS